MDEKDYSLDIGENAKETGITLIFFKYGLSFLIVFYVLYKIFSYVDLFITPQNDFTNEQFRP